MASGIVVKALITDDQASHIEQAWSSATPEEKLAWFNSHAARPCGARDHWREILELANYFAEELWKKYHRPE